MEKLPPQARWWDWPAIALLFILLQTVAARLVTTSWTPFLYLTQTFTYIGYVIGTVLGFSRFKRGTARWLAFIYMLIMLPLQWTLVIDQQVSLEEQLASVAGRLFFSISDFFARRPVEDPFFFVALMSIAFWIISVSAGFQLTRHQNYLAAVLPGAVGLMIIQSYDNVVHGRLWILAFFAFIALLLLGRLHFLQNQKSWQARRVFLSPDNSLDMTTTIAVAAGLIIMVSWTAPASLSSLDSAVKTWNRFTRPWRDFTHNLENAVEALESPSGGRRGEFFGTELALGQGFPLSDTIMFSVEVPDLPADQGPPRYYWRGRTYDHFVQGQWYTTGTTREEYSPAAGISLLLSTGQSEPARFVFDTGDTTFSLLYAPSQPVWVSRPGSTLTIPAETSRELISWNATPALQAGETYQVDAVLNNPNIRQLRAAGESYPQWVKDKYLQLPQNFSPAIRQLAADITADSETPYDKAVAITRFLRENIEYAPTISRAPRNKDMLEWILFEYKKGYCVYYASAEILMLRSLGVPARMAVGFAQGERVDENRFTVRRFNAHAWPEVYFPGIGWVEFEPTANQTALTRPVAPQDPLDGSDAFPRDSLRVEDGQNFAGREQPLEEGLDPATQPAATATPILYLLLFLAVLAGLAVFFSQRYALSTRLPSILRMTMERTGIETPAWITRWERWAGLSPIEKAFESINFGLRQLDDSPPIHATPAERAEKLSHILTPLADQIKVLLDEHQTSLYTSRTADINRARRAALDIRAQTVLARVRRLLLGRYVTGS
ncbi:MAG TPA: transglutaminase-like domain-containing protein [Anaerolineales bacterium]|nr:transglutaminase-like domain-containing protein [Anaerolineales bacterium]